MSRARITIAVKGKIFAVRGWQAKQLAEAAGLRPIFSAVSGGWIADEKRLGDLLAFLDDRHIAYRLEDDRQSGLFDGGDAA